jgi:hypothetical protein
MLSLGTSYSERDPRLAQRLAPLVEFLEVTPDSIATMIDGRPVVDEDALAQLEELSESTRILAHGVGLSIGSATGWNDDYLRILDKLAAHVPLAWHSEHLGYTHVEGTPLGTMLALPRVEESLDLLCPRIETLQARYPMPFLLEHVVNLLPDFAQSDYSPAGFLNEIVRRTGCGLLLDVYNLECDAHNGHVDARAFLGELDFSAVREIHIANGVERRGLMLDVHSRTTRPETRALLDDVLPRATHAEVLVFEFLSEAVPILGPTRIAGELEQLRRWAA